MRADCCRATGGRARRRTIRDQCPGRYLAAAGVQRSGADRLTIARGRAYLKAGASCIYPITVSDPDDILALTRAIEGPVNVMMRAGVPLIVELEKLGVARVTFGSGMMLATQALTQRIAQEILTTGTCELLNAR